MYFSSMICKHTSGGTHFKTSDYISNKMLSHFKYWNHAVNFIFSLWNLNLMKNWNYNNVCIYFLYKDSFYAVKISNQILTSEHFADNNLWIFKVYTQIRKFKIVYKENNISILCFVFVMSLRRSNMRLPNFFLMLGNIGKIYLFFAGVLFIDIYIELCECVAS